MRTTHTALLLFGLLLVISGCSLGPPAIIATSTPTASPTSSPTPTLRPSPTLQPTNTPLPTATATQRRIVVLPPPCTHDLDFIADLSIPDGTPVVAGSVITKTWRVRNTGTCTWNSNYTFRQIGGDALTAATITAPVVGAGQVVDLSVMINVGINTTAYDDLERATFRMYTGAGVPFGQTPYVEVAIRAPSAGECIDLPRLTNGPTEIGSLVPNEIDTINWTILNDGTCTWEGYTIERLGSGSPLLGLNLPLTLPTIAPGESYTFAVNVQIGAGHSPSGLYSMTMALLDGSNTGTGLIFAYNSEYDAGTACVWDSDFVEDVTIPDGTVVNIGQTFTKTWRIENSGTCVWDQFTFVKIEDETSAFEVVTAGATDRVSVPFVAVGEQVDISVTFSLRDTVAAGETVRATFQIQGVQNNFFGTRPYVEIEAAG